MTAAAPPIVPGDGGLSGAAEPPAGLGFWPAPLRNAFSAPFARAARRRAVAAVLAAPGGRVLEIGVGRGASLLQYGAGRRVTAIDSSPGVVRRALRALDDGGLRRDVLVMCRESAVTGFAPDSFDVAVAMPPPPTVIPAIIPEMRRVVRPGGTLVLLVRSGSRPWSAVPVPWPGFSAADVPARFSRLPPFGCFELAVLGN